MRHLSPLRYPGGKASLAPLLEDLIDLNDLRGRPYYEPFAGGAGAALALLADAVVSCIHINDADFRVYAFWQACLEEPQRFIGAIQSTQLTIDEWRKQQSICSNHSNQTIFDVGFATFYMNRCNRSGVVNGGPIGGYSQSGDWKLDVRFNRDGLSQRVAELAKFRDCITTSNLDAVVFLKKRLPGGLGRAKVLAYLDPPYVNKGQRLYLNAYEHGDHATLARYMLSQKQLRWVMSYDESELIQTLYSGCRQGQLPAKYSLQNKRMAREMIIAPQGLNLPYACRPSETAQVDQRATA